MIMNCEVEKAVCPEVKKSSKEPGKWNFLISIFIDILLLYFFNNLIYFNIPFLTRDIVSCLWAINLTLGFGIIGNFVLLLYHPRWFIHLIQVVINGLSILAVLTIYKIFPFTFSNESYQSAAKILLIIIMAGNGVGLVVELVKTLRAIPHNPNPRPPPSDGLDQTPPETKEGL
jgi:hypothetical protein